MSPASAPVRYTGMPFSSRIATGFEPADDDEAEAPLADRDLEQRPTGPTDQRDGAETDLVHLAAEFQHVVAAVGGHLTEAGADEAVAVTGGAHVVGHDAADEDLRADRAWCRRS